METRKLLVDSAAKIADLRLDQAGSDNAGSAFNSFRKGVVHASSGRTGSPEMLLADLEPKDHILTFLVEFYNSRRIFRKQVGGVLSELLRIDSWFLALRNDKALLCRLPDELASLLAEREEEEKEDAEADAEIVKDVAEGKAEEQPALPVFPSLPPVFQLPSPTQSWLTPIDESPLASRSQGTPSFSSASAGSPEAITKSPLEGYRRPKLKEIKAVIKKAAAANKTVLPIRAAGPTATGHYAPGNIRRTVNEQDALCELLEHGRTQIESLDFSAADKDSAVSAFETFRRAVQQVVNSALSNKDDNILECVEPKGKILEFLVDMYERHQRYRSRVTSTLTCLLNFDGWRTAADSDASVHAAVHDFQDTRSMSTFTSVGVSLNVKSAAAAAVSRGGVGAVYVQIIAGHNLVVADSNGSSDPYVRVRLGTRTQRTNVICDCLNPKWNANPFIFEVPSRYASLKIECLDSDFFKDDPLGELEIMIADIPTDPERSVMRRALSNVAHGELEFKLLYVHGKGALPEPVPAAQATVPAKGQVPAAADTCTSPASPSSPSSLSTELFPEAAGSRASALWTPWGPAAPSEVGAVRTESRPRTVSSNPFEAQQDSPTKQAGYLGAADSRRQTFSSAPLSAASTTPGSRHESPRSDAVQVPVRTSATASKIQPTFKPTNPFADAADVPVVSLSFSADSKKPSASAVGTNPFLQDPRTTGLNSSTPRTGASRNPFLCS